VREIGPAMTKELVMTGRRFTAAEAKQIGFLNRVVPADELDAEVDSLVAQLVEKSALTLMITKRHVDGITSAMVQLGRSHQDADGFVSALFDDESRAVAARYFERFQGRRASLTTDETSEVGEI
jgi:enoyl-CoA hydratase/carnithine racemase